jgi:hypothetical protein
MCSLSLSSKLDLPPAFLANYSLSTGWSCSQPNKMVPGPIHSIIGTSGQLTVLIYDLYVLWMDAQQ